MKSFFKNAWYIFRYRRWERMPRPSYCDMCGVWTWCYPATPSATTAYNKARLCEECNKINDEEWRLIWEDYYGSRL